MAKHSGTELAAVQHQALAWPGVLGFSSVLMVLAVLLFMPFALCHRDRSSLREGPG